MKLMSLRLAAAALGLMLMPGLAQAESYASLVRQGYKTGKLSQAKSGNRGWVVTKGDKQFFCQLGVASANNGSGVVFFSSAGRMLFSDGKVFHKTIGGRDPNMAEWKDLQAGRPRPQDVGSCGPHRR